MKIIDNNNDLKDAELFDCFSGVILNCKNSTAAWEDANNTQNWIISIVSNNVNNILFFQLRMILEKQSKCFASQKAISLALILIFSY